MQNKLFLTIILIMLLAISAAARTVKYVELGINRSSFRNESCIPGRGITVGYGFDYYENPLAKGFFMGTAILYQNKKLKIKNHTVASAIPPESSTYVTIKNHSINLSCVEIPIKIGYSFMNKKNFKFIFFSGIGISVPIQDNTTNEIIYSRRLEPEEEGKYVFDYVLLDETSVTTSFNTLLGTSLIYNHFSFNIVYNFANSATQNISGISLEDKIDSIKMTFAYLF